VQHGKLTRADYEKIAGVPRATANRDLAKNIHHADTDTPGVALDRQIAQNCLAHDMKRAVVVFCVPAIILPHAAEHFAVIIRVPHPTRLCPFQSPKRALVAVGPSASVWICVAAFCYGFHP